MLSTIGKACVAKAFRTILRTGIKSLILLTSIGFFWAPCRLRNEEFSQKCLRQWHKLVAAVAKSCLLKDPAVVDMSDKRLGESEK
jgi:hypothetical protein